jgi:hypothetical protein
MYPHAKRYGCNDCAYDVLAHVAPDRRVYDFATARSECLNCYA